MQLRTQEYETKSKTLDSLIRLKLVQAEAKKRGISAEKLIEQEVESKVADPAAHRVALGDADGAGTEADPLDAAGVADQACDRLGHAFTQATILAWNPQTGLSWKCAQVPILTQMRDRWKHVHKTL